MAGAEGGVPVLLKRSRICQKDSEDTYINELAVSNKKCMVSAAKLP
jgi:hypothetical protein